MNWRAGYKKESGYIYRQSDILRAVIIVSKVPQEISDIIDRMECLPEGLQSHIAWDIVNNPYTTVEIYKRVKDNFGLLSNTDAENIQSAWNRNHIYMMSQI